VYLHRFVYGSDFRPTAMVNDDILVLR